MEVKRAETLEYLAKAMQPDHGPDGRMDLHRNDGLWLCCPILNCRFYLFLFICRPKIKVRYFYSSPIFGRFVE